VEARSCSRKHPGPRKAEARRSIGRQPFCAKADGNSIFLGKNFIVHPAYAGMAEWPFGEELYFRISRFWQSKIKGLRLLEGRTLLFVNRNCEWKIKFFRGEIKLFPEEIKFFPKTFLIAPSGCPENMSEHQNTLN
jgi:hypothetical protein